MKGDMQSASSGLKLHVQLAWLAYTLEKSRRSHNSRPAECTQLHYWPDFVDPIKLTLRNLWLMKDTLNRDIVGNGCVTNIAVGQLGAN